MRAETIDSDALPVRFSVVIPCHDGAATLAGCLSSLQQTARGDVEVIVVDDASTDGSGDLAERLGARVIRCARNRGPAVSRNRGATEARGDIVVFVDADVIAPPEIFERLSARFDEDPDLSALNAVYRRDYKGASLFGRFFNVLMHVEMTHRPFTISTSFCAIRRCAFERCGGFYETIDAPYADDVTFGWTFLDQGLRSDRLYGVEVTHLKPLTLLGWVRHSLYHGAYWARSFVASFPRSAKRRNRPVNATFRARNVVLAAVGVAATATGAPLVPTALAAAALIALSSRRLLDDMGRHEGPMFAAFAALVLAGEALLYLGGALLGGASSLVAATGASAGPSPPARAALSPARRGAVEVREAVEYLTEGYRKRFTGEGPLFVTWFVTAACNAKCPHCFYWRNLNAHRDDLTLAEVRRVSATMGTFRNLLLSGGEPFLRRDLDAFCRIVCNGNGVRLLTIPTNAIPVESLLRQARSIAEGCPDTRIFIQISVDGLPETHDRWRGVPGAFARLEASYRGLEKLRATYPNLQPTFLYSFMRQNQDEAIPTFQYLRDRLGAENINVNLVRGDAMDATCKDISVEKYRHAVEYLLDLTRPGPDAGVFGQAYWRRHAADYRLIYRTIKEGRCIQPCHAGRLNAVIDERGRVYSCEILGHPIGDLRAVDLDFQRVWNSDEARRLRRRIRAAQCFCTHETNASINTTFNAGALAQTLLGEDDWGPRDGGGPAPQRGETLGRELAGQTPWWRSDGPETPGGSSENA